MTADMLFHLHALSHAPACSSVGSPFLRWGRGRCHEGLCLKGNMDAILSVISTDSTKELKIVRELHLQD